MSAHPVSLRPPERAQLVIADDHELTRVGLRGMLSGERDIEIIGEAATGREAWALCRRLHPDLALLDVRMPDMDGLEATRAIKQDCPRTAVVIVTVFENADYLFSALKAGAAGYLLKDATRRDLLAAVRQVLRGDSILNGDLAARALHRLARETAHPADAGPERLTPREREVLHLLVQGLTNRQIARTLVISVSTAKAHVEHIIGKLGVSDRTQAAVKAVEMGIVPFGGEQEV